MGPTAGPSTREKQTRSRENELEAHMSSRKPLDETAEANCDEAHQEEFRKGRPRAKEFGSYVLEAPGAGKVLGLVATSEFKRRVP